MHHQTFFSHGWNLGMHETNLKTAQLCYHVSTLYRNKTTCVIVSYFHHMLFSPYASDHYFSYELALNVSHQNMHKTMNDANVGFS